MAEVLARPPAVAALPVGRPPQQQLPMVGRTAEYGDDLGSRLLAATLVDDLIWLAFAVCRRWPPYAKWRGTLLRTLPAAEDLTASLSAATRRRPHRRGRDPVESATRTGAPPPSAAAPFWDRPYRTINPQVPDALLADITDPRVTRLPRTVGSIEQWAHGVDVLADPNRRSALQAAYKAWIAHR